jgi:hypothetical protein
MPIDPNSNPVNIKVVSMYLVLPFLPMLILYEITTSIRAVPAHTLPPKLLSTTRLYLGLAKKNLLLFCNKKTAVHSFYCTN